MEEVLRHQDNGLLVDFFDTEAIAAAAVEALSNPSAYQAVRQRARQTIVDTYDLRSLALPAQPSLLKEAMAPQRGYLWRSTNRYLRAS